MRIKRSIEKGLPSHSWPEMQARLKAYLGSMALSIELDGPDESSRIQIQEWGHPQKASSFQEALRIELVTAAERDLKQRFDMTCAGYDPSDPSAVEKWIGQGKPEA